MTIRPKIQSMFTILIIALFWLAGCSNSSNILESSLLSPASLKVDAIVGIYRASESKDPYIRTYAMEGLVQIGTVAGDNLIVKSLSDETVAVRSAAAIAVGDRKIESARSKLETMLSDPDIMIRLCVGYGLEKLGDTRFVNWYDNALESSIERYAGQSCLLLGKLGTDGYRQNSIEKLREVMSRAGQKPYIRLQAAEALARLGDSSVKQRLLDFAGSGYADDRLLTISALKLLGSNECYAMLSVLAYDDQLEVKLSALRALGTLAGEEDRAPAYQALKYQDPYQDESVTQRIRHLAILAIGSFGRDGDLSILKDFINGKDQMLALTACIAVLDWGKARMANGQ